MPFSCFKLLSTFVVRCKGCRTVRIFTLQGELKRLIVGVGRPNNINSPLKMTLNTGVDGINGIESIRVGICSECW